ncbi:MAG: serine/threonine-protein kinase, partial [Myxococcales bacterium]
MGTRFGRYDLVKKLAAGGMGEVWLAKLDTGGFSKRVVLKLVLPQLLDNLQIGEMFLDEARLALGLSHPNVPQVFDAGEASGIPFLAMEYVHGVDLQTVLKKLQRQGQRVPVPLAVRIAVEIASALDYAHHARGADGQPLNLVHRDVSPQNVLLGFDGGVRLIDFGIAKSSGRSVVTADGMVKGKFPYIAPEQARGDAVDGRTDLFALGAVLHESLSGTPLFLRDSDVATLSAVIEAPIPPLAGNIPGVDAAVAKRFGAA